MNMKSKRNTIRWSAPLLLATCLSACGSDSGDARVGRTVALTTGKGSGVGGSGGGGAVLTLDLPEVGIGVPRYGEALYDHAGFTSPWYDPPTGRIDVRGSIKNVPPGALTSGRIQVIIDGQYGATIVGGNAATREVFFEGSTLALDNPQWVQRFVMVEVVDTTTVEVVARSTNVYYDLRREEHTVLDASTEKLTGLALQLTDLGVGYDSTTDNARALEVPLLSALPYPSMTSFQEELEETAIGAPQYDDDQNQLGACINLSDLDSRFTGLPAYIEAQAQAVVYLAAYEAYQKGGEQACTSVASSLAAVNPLLGFVLSAGCSLIMSNWCVTDLPEASDYELCIDQLEGRTTSMTIDGVEHVQLEWLANAAPAEGHLASQFGVEGVSGRVDGLLRSMQIRWAQTSCTGQPVAAIADTSLDDGDWLEDFATCPDMELNAARATTTVAGGEPATFSVKRHVSAPEILTVLQTAPGTMKLVDTEVDAAKGMCADDTLLTHAETMAATFEAHFAEALNEAWNAGGNRPQLAVALEQVLSTLQLGTLAIPDYVFDAHFSVEGSLPQGGGEFSWQTEVKALDPETIKRLSPGMFLNPAAEASYFATGENNDGEAFDLSYTVTTGFLNQLLHTKSASDLLHFIYEPTWDDLAGFGATPASTGHAADQPPPLDGTVLAFIEPSFAALGNKAVRIRVEPTLDALAWMNPDPPSMLNDPVTGAPLAMGIGGLNIVFEEPPTLDPLTGAEVPGLIWLQLQFSGWDWDFRLDGTLEPRDVLVPRYVFDYWGVSVQKTRLTGCPQVPHGIWEPLLSCERALESTLQNLFAPLIAPRLLQMLTDSVPAPEVWTAGAAAVQTQSRRVFKQNQNITYYLDIANE